MSPRATTTSPTILAILLVTLIGHLQFHPFTTPTQGTSDAGIFVLAASSLLALYLVTIPGLLRRRQSGSGSSTFTHVVREANDLIFLSGAMVWLWSVGKPALGALSSPAEYSSDRLVTIFLGTVIALRYTVYAVFVVFGRATTDGEIQLDEESLVALSDEKVSVLVDAPFDPAAIVEPTQSVANGMTESPLYLGGLLGLFFSMTLMAGWLVVLLREVSSTTFLILPSLSFAISLFVHSESSAEELLIPASLLSLATFHLTLGYTTDSVRGASTCGISIPTTALVIANVHRICGLSRAICVLSWSTTALLFGRLLGLYLQLQDPDEESPKMRMETAEDEKLALELEEAERAVERWQEQLLGVVVTKLKGRTRKGAVYLI